MDRMRMATARKSIAPLQYSTTTCVAAQCALQPTCRCSTQQKRPPPAALHLVLAGDVHFLDEHDVQPQLSEPEVQQLHQLTVARAAKDACHVVQCVWQRAGWWPGCSVRDDACVRGG
eukprot:174243-Chlamydomonas_euryale.AAC.1